MNHVDSYRFAPLLLARAAVGQLGTEAWGQEMWRREVVLPAPPAEIEIWRNLVYREVDGVKLKMDIYLPPLGSRVASGPAVVFIHGGPLPSDCPLARKTWGSIPLTAN